MRDWIYDLYVKEYTLKTKKNINRAGLKKDLSKTQKNGKNKSDR